MGYKRASAQFNVPQNMLECYVQKKFQIEEYTVSKIMSSFTHVFTPEQEAELADYLIMIEAQLFRLTINELRELAMHWQILTNSLTNLVKVEKQAQNG